MEGQLQNFKDLLKNASKIKIDPRLGTENLALSSVHKLKLLTDSVARGSVCLAFMRQKEIIKKLTKCICQQTTREKQAFVRTNKEQLRIKCFNSEKLTWEDTLDQIQEKEFSSAPLSAEELSFVCTLILQNLFIPTEMIFTSFDIFSEDVKNECIQEILENLPVMLISKDQTKILVNLPELILEKNVFLDLICMAEHPENKNQCQEPDVVNEEVNQAAEVPVNQANVQQEQTDDNERRKKRGPAPIHEKFPEMVNMVTNFLKQHSFCADNRRRNSTFTGNGVSLQEIKEHLEEQIPELKEHGTSRNTIHCLFVAPLQNTHASARYRGLIQARVPHKKNSYRENSENQHFLFSRVAYREELVTKFKDCAQFLSVDDMNKIHVGTPAVSRFHQLRRFFLNNEGPNYADHDFPLHGHLLIPSGYMLLEWGKPEEQKEDEQENPIDEIYTDISTNDIFEERDEEDENASERPEITQTEVFEEYMTTDKLGRKHFIRPMAGKSIITLRASKYHLSTAASHANDLIPVIKELMQKEKTVIFIKADNGPDWNLSSLTNQYYFFKAWKMTGLDMLVVCSFAAKWSAYNNIEHLWSPQSRLLTGVVLPAIAQGDDRPPSQMRLSDEERKEKEAVIFDSAMNEIAFGYWKDAKFNGYPITTIPVACLEKEFPFDDYHRIHKLITGPIRQLRASELINELRNMLKHMERKSNELVFRKCQDLICHHCTKNPVKATEFWNYLEKRHFKLPNPLQSQHHPGHYMTFLEIEEKPHDDICTGDDGLPVSKSAELGSCSICPHYLFMSKTEKQRHMSVFHANQKEKQQATRRNPTHRCAFKEDPGDKECGLLFTSRKKLLDHKKISNHLLKRRRKVQSKRNLNKRRKLLNLEQFFNRDTESESESDNDGKAILDGEKSDNDESDNLVNDDASGNFAEREEVNIADDYNVEIPHAKDDERCYICNEEEPPDETENEDENEDDEGEIKWVCCETCKKWFHHVCVQEHWPTKYTSISADLWNCHNCEE